MKVLEKFKELSLAQQLQVLFTTSATFLILLLILIAYYLIYWLKTQLTDETSQLVDDTLEKHMIRIMQLESVDISFAFSYYLSVPVYLANLHQQVCEGRFPLTADEGTFNVTKASRLNKGVFYSKETVSEEGFQLVHNESSLDQMFPLLISSNLIQIYLGFELDYLFHIYPAYEMKNFNPLIREWYYSAKDSPGFPVFTEPYLDAASGHWIISASDAIFCDGRFVGSAAADVTLESLRNSLNEANLPSGAFFLLVSATGLIVTMPELWGGETARLNDTQRTGFPAALWQIATDPTTPYDYKYVFTDENSTIQVCYRNKIAPSGQPRTTHYLFICSPEANLGIFSQDPNKVFQNSNSEIFWIVFSVAVSVFVGTVGIIFWISKKIAGEFNVLVSTIYGICAKSIFPDSLSYYKAREEERGNQIFGLLPKGIEKIKKLKGKENDFFNFSWGVTRPNDKFLFNDWQTRRYPKNFKSCVQIRWRELFAELIRRTFNSGNFD